MDEEEALTASQTGLKTTSFWTRTEATPTLIQGGTPRPLEGSLVLPHARKHFLGQHRYGGSSIKYPQVFTSP